MYKNKWIYVALTLGLILSIITITVIPMFTRSSQDRLIRQNLDESKKSTKIYPANILYNYKNTEGEGGTVTEEFMGKVDKVSDESTKKLNLPILSNRRMIQTSKFLFWDSNKDILKDSKEITEYNLVSIKDIKEHITILKGRMPKASKDENGIQEVLVHKNIYNQNNLDMDILYQTTLDSAVDEVIQSVNKPDYKNVKFKIVGIYELKESDFWIRGTWYPGQQFFLTDIDTHMKMINIKPNRYEYFNEYYLDYSKLRYSQVNPKEKGNIGEIFRAIQKDTKDNGGTVILGLEDTIKKIESKMGYTISMMIIILMPLLFMLIVYILMISKIIANNDSNEISLLKSRGAKLYQIFTPYIIKGIVMGIIGIIIGPIISKYIVKAMGNTTEFLSFGNGTDLISYGSPLDYVLSILVIVVFIIAMLIPVYITSKKTIVELKREKYRIAKSSLWKKYGVDIIILISTSYCFYNFIIKEFATTKGSMATDPMMYLIISGICLGVTLLFLRFYPYVIKGIFRFGKKLWKPETYYILLYSARNSAKKEYIMIFLIFTLSIGVFNMNSARKINREGENNISYINGSDIVVSELYGKAETRFDKNYKKYKDANGIENTAKVLPKNQVRMMADTKTKISPFMAINPYEFGKVAWMRNDLFPNNWINYLNALTLEPSGILISNNLVKEGFKVGDKIKMQIPHERELPTEPGGCPVYTMEYRIVGSFNYWPGWNSKEKGHESLIIGNYDYLIEETALMKYEVWLDTKPDVKSEDIKRALIKNHIQPESFSAMDVEIEKFKTSIFTQTINGTYTFAFIMTMIVAFTGVIIYWALSIKERELQFGIIRALGVSKKSVYKMIFIEQIISTIVALGIGVLIGTKMFEVFAPITNEQNIQGSIELPILVEYMKCDYMEIFGIVGLITTVVLTILIAYISKLKINQAVKLGED